MISSFADIEFHEEKHLKNENSKKTPEYQVKFVSHKKKFQNSMKKEVLGFSREIENCKTFPKDKNYLKRRTTGRKRFLRDPANTEKTDYLNTWNDLRTNLPDKMKQLHDSHPNTSDDGEFMKTLPPILGLIDNETDDIATLPWKQIEKNNLCAILSLKRPLKIFCMDVTRNDIMDSLTAGGHLKISTDVYQVLKFSSPTFKKYVLLLEKKRILHECNDLVGIAEICEPVLFNDEEQKLYISYVCLSMSGVDLQLYNVNNEQSGKELIKSYIHVLDDQNIEPYISTIFPYSHPRGASIEKNKCNKEKIMVAQEKKENAHADNALFHTLNAEYWFNQLGESQDTQQSSEVLMHRTPLRNVDKIDENNTWQSIEYNNLDELGECSGIKYFMCDALKRDVLSSLTNRGWLKTDSFLCSSVEKYLPSHSVYLILRIVENLQQQIKPVCAIACVCSCDNLKESVELEYLCLSKAKYVGLPWCEEDSFTHSQEFCFVEDTRILLDEYKLSLKHNKVEPVFHVDPWLSATKKRERSKEKLKPTTMKTFPQKLQNKNDVPNGKNNNEGPNEKFKNKFRDSCKAEETVHDQNTSGNFTKIKPFKIHEQTSNNLKHIPNPLNAKVCPRRKNNQTSLSSCNSIPNKCNNNELVEENFHIQELPHDVCPESKLKHEKELANPVELASPKNVALGEKPGIESSRNCGSANNKCYRPSSVEESRRYDKKDDTIVLSRLPPLKGLVISGTKKISSDGWQTIEWKNFEQLTLSTRNMFYVCDTLPSAIRKSFKTSKLEISASNMENIAANGRCRCFLLLRTKMHNNPRLVGVAKVDGTAGMEVSPHRTDRYLAKTLYLGLSVPDLKGNDLSAAAIFDGMEIPGSEATFILQQYMLTLKKFKAKPLFRDIMPWKNSFQKVTNEFRIQDSCTAPHVMKQHEGDGEVNSPDSQHDECLMTGGINFARIDREMSLLASQKTSMRSMLSSVKVEKNAVTRCLSKESITNQFQESALNFAHELGNCKRRVAVDPNVAAGNLFLPAETEQQYVQPARGRGRGTLLLQQNRLLPAAF